MAGPLVARLGGLFPRSFGGRVDFDVPRRVAFGYLVDPAHRAEWQSSLARVEDVQGEIGEGQSWTDVTRPGLRPRMRTTAYVPGRRWSETGSWRFVRADLTLDFDVPLDDDLRGDPRRCVVEFNFRIRALGPVGTLASLVSVPAVAADLRRAAVILSRRQAQPPPA